MARGAKRRPRQRRSGQRKSRIRVILREKGVSGKVITLVITLIIAIVALVLLWAFLSETQPMIVKAVEGFIDGVKRMICKNVPVLNWPIIKDLFGC